MIAIRLEGRLGNQMFQYAFGFSLSKSLKKTVFYDEIVTKMILRKYFDTPIKSQRAFKIFVKLRKLIFGYNLKKTVVIENDHHYRPLIEREQIDFNDTYYVGYFQSKNYFYEHQKEIKEHFNIKKKHVNEFNKRYGNYYLDNKIIAVHIRKTDYTTHGDPSLGGVDLSLPITYYKTVFELVKNISEYKIIFVGDDLSEAKKCFGEMENTVFEQNNEIIDFQIIQNADIAIISNSTFAWWAAYLNKKTEKIIYAPKYWLGYRIKKNYPIGIYDRLSWSIIDFETQSPDN